MGSQRNNISILTLLLRAIKKTTPYGWLNNPMLQIVFITACFAFALLIKEISFPTGRINLYAQMVLWIWLTLFFSALSESYAESKLSPKERNSKDHHAKVKRIKNLSAIDEFTEVSIEQIKSGNLIILRNGDFVPFDGIIMHGTCSVNETNITGSLGNVIKTNKNNNILKAGSVVEGRDYIIMKVSFAPKISFVSKIRRMLKNIKHQSLPSELALQRLIMGISILFLAVIFTVWVIAKYSGFNIPLIYLLDLVVILLPTTIAGLQRSIIILGKAKLYKSHLIVHNPVALDNAIDINMVLLDKTGTLTIGKRQATDFHNISKFSEEDYAKYLFLSSLKDVTFEGRSIKNFAKKHYPINIKTIDQKLYKLVRFSASNPISGCDYDGMEIRKGSVQAILAYLKKSKDQLPQKVIQTLEEISASHGTPLLLTVNKKVVGVIHLTDKLRKGVIMQIDKLRKAGFKVAMLTGDNSLTASFIAKKLNIDKCYADATPEKKLSIIKGLQNKGYIVAMCGDGANDSLALAQADIGLTLAQEDNIRTLILAGNVTSKIHNLLSLIDLKNICKIIATRRGSLTIFSLSSDIAKYFVIVPAMFTTAFPPLSALNLMQFRSLEGVVLASIMFNALTILALIPILIRDYTGITRNHSTWTNITLYSLGGITSPFLGIKLLEMFIYQVGLL